MTTKSMHKIGISALTLLLSVASARADQIAWDNGSGMTGTGLWGTGANWYNNTTNFNSDTPPASTDDVRLGKFGSLTLGSGTNGFPANAAYIINLESNRTVNSLLLDNAFGSKLTIGANATNVLTITSGNITRAATTSDSAFSAPVTLGANAIWTLNGNSETQFADNANISGAGLTLTKRGSSTLRFGRITNNIANLILENGTTRFTTSPALGSGTLLWTSAEGDSKLTYIGFFSAVSTVNKNSTFSTPTGTTRNYEFSLDDTDREAVNNDGTGRVTLSGALTGNFAGEFRLKASSQRDPASFVAISGNTNTYSGGITRIITAPPINATDGTTVANRVPDSKVILTNTSGSAFGTTDVSLNSATSSGANGSVSGIAGAKTRAYLGGTGRFTGAVSIGQNIAFNISNTTPVVGATGSGAGIIAPGGTESSFTGIGTLSTGSVTLNANSSFRADLNGTAPGSFDQLNVTGNVDLGGAALELSSAGLTANNGDKFTLINNDDADAVNGTFNGLPQGATVGIASQLFTISYVGGTGNDVVLTAAGAVANSGVIISEFRFHGATSPMDEYVEITNTLGTPLNISGWKIQTNTAAGIKDTLVPQNTVVPARGHFLFTGSGYSLSTYGPSDASIANDILDDSGVALLNAAGTLQDAVGFITSDSTLKEGLGLDSAPNVDGETAFMRDFNNSLPKDSSDSTKDFVFVATNAASNFDPGTGTFGAPATVSGTNGSIPAQLGAPNPQGLASPVYANDQVTNSLLDPGASQSASPNRVRTGSGNGGTLVIRRTLKNNTSRPLTRIRFSVTRITSDGSAIQPGNTLGSQAIIRLTSSATDTAVSTTGGLVTVFGTTLEAGAAGTGLPNQPLGGGLGSSASFFDVTLSKPLAPSGTAGDSRNYSFVFDIIKSGNFTAILNIEALPTP